MGKDHKTKPFVYWVAIVAAVGGLLFGFDIGGSGGTFVMEGFRDQMGWDKNCPAGQDCPDEDWVNQQKGWITSTFSLGALVGALPSGMMADFMGRKIAIMLMSVWFTIGVTIQMLTPHEDDVIYNEWVMYAGRIIGGSAIGALSCIVPMYQQEISPAHVRGALSTLWQLCITFGIVMAGASNIGLREVEWGWRISYGGNVVFPIALFVFMICCPESPRWLIQKGKHEEGRKSLARTRYPDDVEFELNEIAAVIDAEEGTGSWLDVFKTKRSMLYRIWVGCFLQMCQQLTGINAIMFFAPDMISQFMDAEAAMYGNLAIQTVNFFATFIAIALIERVGRKILLITGCVIMIATCFAIGGICSMDDYADNEAASWSIVALCCVYVIGFAYSWGPVVWVVCSEMFPQDLRGKSCSLTTATNWAFASVVGKFVPLLYPEDVMGLMGVFLMFGGLCVFHMFFVWIFYPETGGASLEEMDDVFKDYKPGFRKIPCKIEEKY